jgi:PKD repeat protein
MEFRLATKDPDGNCTYGVTRIGSDWTENSGSKVMALSNWDDKKYVNIYVVKSFDENMSSAAAYATKPGSGSSEYGDYIFCKYDYFGDWNVNNDNGPTNGNWARHTVPHEMGHFFNLDHPWGGSNSPAEDGNCSIDDGVDDTPPTIGTDGNAVGCPLDQATCDGSLDNVQNIMDYSSCAHMFTQGQSNRMLAAANSLAGNRWYLWQTDNLVATGTDDESFFNEPYAACSPTPDFQSDTDLGCAGAEIKFDNYTFNYREETITYAWEFEGGSPSTSTQKSPTIQFNEPGSYNVKLTACNGDLCKELEQDNYVTILSQVNVSADEGLNQGFESSDFPVIDSEIWWSGDDYSEQHWERTELASTEGNAAFKIKSQNYNYDRSSHEFSTPELNMSEFETTGSDPLMLCFDLAYAKRLPYTAVSFDEAGIINDQYSIHNDDLIISYKGCDDANWTERPRLSTRPGVEGLFLSQQQTLFTTDKVYFNSFVPTESEWRQVCVNIQQLAGDQEAIVKFEFIGTGQDQFQSHWVDDGFTSQGELITASTIGGNWLYLDNIKIGRSSDVQGDNTTSRNENLNNLVVAPNPSLFNSGSSISFNLDKNEDLTFVLMNFIGNSVQEKRIQFLQGDHTVEIDEIFKVPSKGSYVLSINSSTERLSEIIIIR